METLHELLKVQWVFQVVREEWLFALVLED